LGWYAATSAVIDLVLARAAFRRKKRGAPSLSELHVAAFLKNARGSNVAASTNQPSHDDA
jgi:hypothetical protein